MLIVFSIDVYALLGSGATLSFVTTLIVKKLDILSDILNEPFIVTTQVGESVIDKSILRNCPIMVPNIVTYVELVELDIFDLDVILGMVWLHDFFAPIDCRTRVVKFNFPNEPILE